MADITMYTTPICPFCYRAKKLLSGKGVNINEVDVMMSPGKRDEMIARSGRRTVPQIFIGDTHVGGFDDLAALDRAGGLDPLLAAPA